MAGNGNSGQGRGGQGAAPPPTSPDWCDCDNCREMPTEEEKKCCKKPQGGCLAKDPKMDLEILNEPVPVDGDAMKMKKLRKKAYRKFAEWYHGPLGKGNRAPLPSCCVWRIRDRYPDPEGNYEGWEPGNEDGNEEN